MLTPPLNDPRQSKSHGPRTSRPPTSICLATYLPSILPHPSLRSNRNLYILYYI